MLPLLLVACTSRSVPLGDESGAPAPDDTAPERLDDAPDTGDPPPPAGPGAVAVSCSEALPLEGKVDCMLRVADADGVVWWDGPAGVGLHGRSSSSFPKPQLAVELRDTAGLQVDADLLGMGEEADWLLNGMWIDRALLRNKLAYDLFRELSDGREWAPESRYVEVTYNGAYYGLFALVERVDRADDRLDIARDEGEGTSFIVKASETGIPSAVQYGAWERIYPNVTTDAVTAGVTAKLSAMEAAILARDPALWDVLDRESAVAFVLLEETVKNNDGFFLSHHLYVHPDGKLRFVPWDLDLSLGQPSYNDNENPASWIAYRPELVQGLAETPGFAEQMATTWATWRANELADGAAEARIDGTVADLGDAVDRNFERWPIEDVDFGGYLYAVGSHEEEIARVKGWIGARLAWMDEHVATYAAEAPG